MEYKEIFKLKEMLEKANIPFEFSPLYDGYHICYPESGSGIKCSVVQHNFSYGNEDDLLEIMGLLTKKGKIP